MNRIGDYALIGDCHSAALVGRDGSIDWACFPRFDSRAVFAKILDEDRGGSFSVAPSFVLETRRAYLPDTNVLVTTFTTGSGELELTDCMPVAPLDTGNPTDVTSCRSILRRARCTAGSVDVVLSVAPRFEYGAFIPRFRPVSPVTAEIIGGADALCVRATHPLEADVDRLHATWSLSAGEEAWVEVVWSRSYEVPEQFGGRLRVAVELERRLAETVAFWRTWMQGCWYDGEWQQAVRRSALTLKALTFAPSGAVVAAATTSLPEWVGGERNWDYRFTWIRDATLTLISLYVLGFTGEAAAFKTWLERTGAGRPEDLQIMYGVGGERSLPETTLGYLSGHRRSAPVRVGNGAVKQLQLDAYGQILEAAYLWRRSGGELSELNWKFVSGLVDTVCRRWRDPDQGIWEIRDEPRHFVHSKLNCWVALDRAVRLSESIGVEAPAEWSRERDAIRDALIEDAERRGWFPQAVGTDVVDASALLVPASGFLPTSDPLVEKTIEVVRGALGQGDLVHRYLATDGLEGREGAFLLCSFWLVDCLTHAGRLDEAQSVLEGLLALANDVGLLSEEVDPETGEALGNFPQAFSHMALVLSCAHLTAAKRGEIPEGARDYSELALDRLLAKLAADVTS